MQFKKWLQQEEIIKQTSDKSRRLQLGRNSRKPEWAPRREIWSMKKK